MKHNTEGLARPCSAWDIFSVTGGLQCGNCLATNVFPKLGWFYVYYDAEDYTYEVGPFASRAAAEAAALHDPDYVPKPGSIFSR